MIEVNEQMIEIIETMIDIDDLVRDSCVQGVCVLNALCPSTGCFTMRCHCLRWLCARCLCYGCISGVPVLYDCVHNICLQVIYPRCLCIWWLCGGCGCAASLSLMPKFEMSVCRMFAINVCLENDCVALISFLWWDLLPSLPLCGISACWMAEICLCVSRISSLDECLLDNCLKNVRVLNG